jgi:putative transposase
MKKVSAVRLVERDEAEAQPGLSGELRVALSDIAGVAREGLLAMSVGVGLGVMAEMMEAEVAGWVGAKYAQRPEREASRHGRAPGSVVLGGRRVRIDRPRARTMAGDEVGLESYATFADDDLLAKVVMARMLAGLATRRHRVANEPIGEVVEAEATSTSRSAVSRRFIAGTTRARNELMSRDLAELDVVVLMVDGVNFGEACSVVALAITSDGTKVPVGWWLGDTENTTVVAALLADLVERGLDASGGLLVVMDGAKALAAGVRKVFGDQALVQRCTLHKRRNIADHLPKDQARGVDRKLVQAFANPDADAGLRARRIWLAASTARIPTRPHRCGRASMRCSPCAGSVSATASRAR